MKKVIVALMLVLATSPAYAMTHKQKQEQQRLRHQHQHQLHKENKIMRKWMDISEKNCKGYQGAEFHSCYIDSMKDIRAKSNISLSPESEQTFKTLVKPSRSKF